MSDGRPRYKFMTNLYTKSGDRTHYVSFLKKISPDPVIPYNKIVISMGAAAIIAVVFVASVMIGGSGRWFYVLPWSILFFISALVIIALFLLPSRGESMLTAALGMFMFRRVESIRRAVSSNGELSSLGVKSISKGGTLKFDDGDLGVVFKVEGQIGFSTLPAVADEVAAIRYRHMIARSDTGQETLITSVKRLNLDDQLDYYKEMYDSAAGDGSDLGDQWRAYMALLHYKFVGENYHNSHTTIEQFKIIRDIDNKSLMKSIETLNASCNAGMLSRVEQLDTRESVIKALSGMTLYRE